MTGLRETWTAKCSITGEEFQCGRINDMFECRNKDRHLCPNFLNHYVKGVNCKLAVTPYIRYEHCVLPSRLEPQVEKLKNRSTVGLAAIFKETEERYLHCESPNTKVELKAVLGAIIVILRERGETKKIFNN